MSPETAATLACTVIGLVVLVLNYKSTNERLDVLETDVETLEKWRSS